MQTNRVGRLSYVRRIPPKLQNYVGNRTVIRRSLGVSSTNQADPLVASAWSRVHRETELLLEQAKIDQAEERLNQRPEVPLTPRHQAGIAAEPWRQLLEMVDNGVTEPKTMVRVLQIREQLKDALPQLQASSDQQQADELKAQVTKQLLSPVLGSLGIRVDERTYAEMERLLYGYMQDFRADFEARKQGDYGSQQLTSKAPLLPEKQVSWENLLDQYAISVGGITEDDGVGVSRDRILQYRLFIKDICQRSGKHFPGELTVDDARRYLNYLQTSSFAVGTQKKRLDGLRHLFNVAIQVGLLDVNPFGSMKIKAPRGAEDTSYRPFSREEFKSIFDLVKAKGKLDRLWVLSVLLCTGARAAEVLKLRHSDIRQTEEGIWYFDFKHRPMDGYPTLLKGAQSGERRTPLHPALVTPVFMEYWKRRSNGYILDLSTETSSWSVWFRSVLISLGIHERKKTCLHSLRSTAIDIWREAGLSGEVRKALVAHANTDTQDRVYGEGLKNMPAVLYKELKKVNYSSYLE